MLPAEKLALHLAAPAFVMVDLGQASGPGACTRNIQTPLARLLTTTSRYPIQTVRQLIQSQAVRKGRYGTPCRLLIGEQGERRFCIHGRDQPIQAKHLSLSLKETGFEDPPQARRTVAPTERRVLVRLRRRQAICRKGHPVAQ